MRLAFAGAAAAALALAVPASAAGPQQVSIQFAAFGPDPIDVLPGEGVHWENVSDRTHTVTADDGSFDSDKGKPADTGPATPDVAAAPKPAGTVTPEPEQAPEGTTPVKPADTPSR